MKHTRRSRPLDLHALHQRAFRRWKGSEAALFQTLEPRRLLSTVGIVANVLTINADNTNDTIAVDPFIDARIAVKLNGATTLFDAGAFTAIRILGNGGNGSLKINSSPS